MASTRKRRRWLWLGLLPALALIGLFSLRALLQPERLSAFLLGQAADATGLELALSEPAGIGLWPDLHLELRGLTARMPGDSTLLLHAARVDAVLPWSALDATSLQLHSLRLHEPTIDVAALQRWLASRADAGPPVPLRLPRLDATLGIEQGRVVGDGWTISGLDLQLPSLRNGEATELALAGRFDRSGKPALPFAVRVVATPRQVDDELRLEPLALRAHEDGLEAPWLRLDGSLTLRHPQQLTFDLKGTMPQWPASWAALPLPATPENQDVQLAFAYTGAPDLQGAATLRVARGDEHLEGSLRLGDLIGWAGDAAATSLPPLQGTLDATRLQFDGVELRGVRVRIGDGVDPGPDDDAGP